MSFFVFFVYLWVGFSMSAYASKHRWGIPERIACLIGFTVPTAIVFYWLSKR